ncbi:hypothetical protein GON03_07785 [Nocardioides sp. MAH-18]|uniref:Right handed beta helix domain-containing protein n=1 Tax=Nocardioides agri TaxID=2682843 RepID=A0A6L6XP82_9ACTN|nr:MULTISPECIES: right-handed parallel beta-helix repeat-containing protein [unclassified Nocardioides]MBA2954218.1 right-handed parallel beta-helix repeat-containing protein [Nocardioides sp. CGMCC 1.13656]MVQ49079.1 hypothetical protein [Nocardioides sp. MAH-18]
MDWRARNGLGFALVAVVVASMSLVGSPPSATSAAAASTSRATHAGERALPAPKVRLELRQDRVTTTQRARVRVSLRLPSVQAQRLTGRVRVTAKGGSTLRRAHGRAVAGKATIALPKLKTGVYRVRATFLGTKRLGRAHSAYQTLRVVTGVGAAGPQPAPPAGFPNASNTGVPAGTTLTAYTGSSTISRANTVIDGKTLGCIEVTAPGVVIRNSKITCKPTYAAVTVDDGGFAGAPLLLEDVEIDCGDNPGHGIGEANVTVRRANIHGCENGLDVNQSITVEDSYIHDLYNSSEAHADGIQLAGHLEGGGFVEGAKNVTIRHNTIYGVGPDGSLGTSAIISNPRGDTNILIEANLLAGGAYTLYCDRPGAGIAYRVIDNHFSTRFSPSVGAFGPTDGCADEERSGNVVHETGAAVRFD